MVENRQRVAEFRLRLIQGSGTEPAEWRSFRKSNGIVLLSLFTPALLSTCRLFVPQIIM